MKGETEASNAFAKLDRKVQRTFADMLVDMSVDAGQKLGTIKAAQMEGDTGALCMCEDTVAFGCGY